MSSEPPSGRPVRSASSRWRYRFVVGLIWIAVFAAAAAGWRYARTSGPAYGPIVIVSIDSLRADRLPVYGYTKVHTPAIEALAADSVSFDRAYAHSPLTLPSHVSMLSGLLPYQSGVRDEVGFPLTESVGLLPQLLHRRGFKTGGVVSNALLRRDTGLGAAFGFFDDELGPSSDPGNGPADGNGVRPHFQNPSENAASTANGVRPHLRDGADAVKVAEQWMDTIGTGRFFLFLHLAGPGAKAGYDAQVAYADEQVGHLVAFLKKRGLYNGGVIVLTSGHGVGLGDHGEDGHGLYLYESVMRVPLIIKLPRRDGGGRHSAALVEHIDIAPTILDLVGAPRPSRLGGRSLRSVLDSPTATIPPRQVYAETLAPRYRFGWSELRSLTDDRYRYIKAPRPELYDVLQDPRERTDLSESDPTRGEAMRAALEKLDSGEAPQPAPIPDAERGRLASMGYPAAMDLPPVLGTDPKDGSAVANAYWQAARLDSSGDAPAAIAAYQDVVKADPQLAAAWDRLSALLVGEGRLREAGEALTALIRLYPEDARTAAADARLRPLIAATPVAADRAVLVASVWATLGEKARAAEVRSAARKAAGDAALRKAEASFKK